MSESILPVSESLILTALGMIGACCAGMLTCILKSRCTKISCGCCSIERDVIPAAELNNVQVNTTT